MKIMFIGHPGAGKTYAATILENKLRINAVDIDKLWYNPMNLIFKRHYQDSLMNLITNKKEWVIDGYGGTYMPKDILDAASHIIFIDQSKDKLRRNVWARYLVKKRSYTKTHGQHLFINVLKNLFQIYFLNGQIKKHVYDIKASDNASKLITVKDKDTLDQLIRDLSIVADIKG